METMTKLSTAAAVNAYAKNVISLDEVLKPLWAPDDSQSIWIEATIETMNTKGQPSALPWIKTPDKLLKSFDLMLKTLNDTVFAQVKAFKNTSATPSTKVYVKLVIQKPIPLPEEVVLAQFGEGAEHANPKAVSNWQKAIAESKINPNAGRSVVAVIQEVV